MKILVRIKSAKESMNKESNTFSIEYYSPMTMFILNIMVQKTNYNFGVNTCLKSL